MNGANGQRLLIAACAAHLDIAALCDYRNPMTSPGVE